MQGGTWTYNGSQLSGDAPAQVDGSKTAFAPFATQGRRLKTRVRPSRALRFSLSVSGSPAAWQRASCCADGRAPDLAVSCAPRRGASVSAVAAAVAAVVARPL